MNPKEPRNIPASVRARLTNIARERREEFQRILVRFVAERFLYRLHRSGHGGAFVLKGAMLFAAQASWPYRSTRDLDLLDLKKRTASELADIVRRVCTVRVEDDGVRFDPASVQAENIREDQVHGGIRVLVTAYLEQAKIRLQIDIGSGDVVVPAPHEIVFPPMLDFPPARIYAYSKDAVVAEKAQALIALGDVNSRMKDFYDFWALSRTLTFEGNTLTAALDAIFTARETLLPASMPNGLTDEFASNREPIWQGFLRRVELKNTVPNLIAVISEVRGFLLPPFEAVREGKSFDMLWQPGGPWRPKE